jgi:hypothetical protein
VFSLGKSVYEINIEIFLRTILLNKEEYFIRTAVLNNNEKAVAWAL